MKNTNEQSKAIGAYLSELISLKFGTQRQFCTAYLKEEGLPAQEDDIQRMENRLSQILNGNKAVQDYDLPAFSLLLGVSYEEIYTAGKCFGPSGNHLTNYLVAASSDEKVWKRYIALEEKPILNADEYGKTVLDYALKFRNYDFLKYLVEQKHIWFVGNDPKKFLFSFGAGTDIQRRPITAMDSALTNEMIERDTLRRKMIVLAIENEDLVMLEKLHAREMRSLYGAAALACSFPELAADKDEEVLQKLSQASEKVLAYFSEEFEIADSFKQKDCYLYPYLGELIDLLVQGKSPAVKNVLQQAIKHNQKTYDRLKKQISKAIDDYMEIYSYDDKKGATRVTLVQLNFRKDGNMISFRNPEKRSGVMTNLIFTEAGSEDETVQALIDELNTFGRNARNIKDEFIS